MANLILILCDQLTESISSLENYQFDSDIVLMCEVRDEVTYVRHHKKKIAFWFAAMRHFAQMLREKNYKIRYVEIDDHDNTGSLKGEVQKLLEQTSIARIIITHPGEYRILDDINSWEKEFNVPVEIRVDNRFLCSSEEFAKLARGRKNLRMEYFYRQMRKKYSILMEGDNPIGGKWNYDSENRKTPKDGLQVPAPYLPTLDVITQEVLVRVSKDFEEHFGDIEPFYFATTRNAALEVFRKFLEDRLLHFGDYQDAMIQGEPWMFHSHISFYLNCGLLDPLECVREVERCYHEGRAPLNAAEGFIRQIIGWREYVRAIYWYKMPKYASENFLGASRQLPELYWTGKTKMNCLSQCVLETKQNAYAHHIQRLMVLGNFALLVGVAPKYVNEWFLIVYADAYEWVELPNVSGMILFADGGYLASKPYAAGGSYINKMSNYCKGCSYNVLEKNGVNACPFNYLYWDFLERNRDKLEQNQRINMMYKNLDKMADEKRKSIRSDSMRFLNNLDDGISV